MKSLYGFPGDRRDRGRCPDARRGSSPRARRRRTARASPCWQPEAGEGTSQHAPPPSRNTSTFGEAPGPRSIPIAGRRAVAADRALDRHPLPGERRQRRPRRRRTRTAARTRASGASRARRMREGSARPARASTPAGRDGVQNASTSFPKLSFFSIRSCASRTLAAGSTASTTGFTRPAATSGSTSLREGLRRGDLLLERPRPEHGADDRRRASA